MRIRSYALKAYGCVVGLRGLVEMTYCLGIRVRDGLVFASDSRTNAGMDAAGTHSKMRFYGVPGERQFVLSWAGNLATTQGVVTQIERDMRDNAPVSLLTVSNVGEAAEYIGAVSLQEQGKNTGGGPVYEASFLIGGEVLGAKCRCHMVYPEGNYIESSFHMPFLQVGESKYGKPILDRVLDMKTPLDQAAMCSLVSMDATMRSNLTVGPPIEMYVYEAGSLQPGRYRSFAEDDEYLWELKRSWDAKVKEAFASMTRINWQVSDG